MCLLSYTTMATSGTMLTSVLYCCLAMTSGAIQYGVPTSDFLREWSGVMRGQKPKSESFTCVKEGG